MHLVQYSFIYALLSTDYAMQDTILVTRIFDQGELDPFWEQTHVLTIKTCRHVI